MGDSTNLFPSRSSCTLTTPMTSRSTSTPRRTRTLFRAPPVSRLSSLSTTKASTQMRRRRAKTAELNDTEKLKKRLEEAGLKDAFKPREGSGVVRPEFDSKGRTINPYAKDEGN